MLFKQILVKSQVGCTRKIKYVESQSQDSENEIDVSGLCMACRGFPDSLTSRALAWDAEGPVFNAWTYLFHQYLILTFSRVASCQFLMSFKKILVKARVIARTAKIRLMLVNCVWPDKSLRWQF